MSFFLYGSHTVLPYSWRDSRGKYARALILVAPILRFLRENLRPMAHCRRFIIRRQASAQAEQQMHATDVCTRTLATHTQLFSVRCSIYGKVSRRDGRSSEWLHPVSLPMKTIIWCCFAADVDVAMLGSEEEAGKRGRISSKIPSWLRQAIFYVFI